MNSNTIDAYMSLKTRQKMQVISTLDIRLSRGIGETGTHFATRVLRQIENEGKMRELESAIADVI